MAAHTTYLLTCCATQNTLPSLTREAFPSLITTEIQISFSNIISVDLRHLPKSEHHKNGKPKVPITATRSGSSWTFWEFNLVELGGIEPPTFWLPVKRSPSWAIAPHGRRRANLSRRSKSNQIHETTALDLSSIPTDPTQSGASPN